MKLCIIFTPSQTELGGSGLQPEPGGLKVMSLGSFTMFCHGESLVDYDVIMFEKAV